MAVLWDQGAFKQVVARRYRGAMRWLRPAYNVYAHLARRVVLPAQGAVLRQSFVSFLTLAPQAMTDRDTARALLADLLTQVPDAGRCPWPARRASALARLGQLQADALCGPGLRRRIRRARPTGWPTGATRGRSAVKLTLIRPNLGDYRSSDAMPPLAMGILAARAPGWDIAFYDEKAETLPTDDRPDLVALSVETFTARRAYAVADAYRQRGVPVVMGGYHPTFLPDEALQHADAVVDRRCRRRMGAAARRLQGPADCSRATAATRSAPLHDYRLRPQHLPRQALRAGGAGAVRSRLPLRLRLLFHPRLLRHERARAPDRRAAARDRDPAGATPALLRRRQPVRRTRPTSASCSMR